MQDNNITDVEFKEVPTEGTTGTASEVFLPANYLINALTAAGHPNPAAWALHVDPRVETAEEEKDRIFFANRALRIYISEQESNDTIAPRMLLAEGIPAAKWCALMDKGIVPWLMGLFDKKGQRIDQKKAEEILAEESVKPAETIANHPCDIGIYEGSLNLSEETKAKLRAFRDQSEHDHIRIDDRTYAKIHRNGQNAMEWYFNDGTVAYPLPYSEYAAGGTRIINAAPKSYELGIQDRSDTIVPDVEEAQACCNQPTDCFLKETPCMNRAEDGSMDSLPDSIKE